MLKLKVVMAESYNEETKEFVTERAVDIELEHSLASLSKWEEIWEVPLLSTTAKTDEQNFSYIQCMVVTPNVAPEVLQNLSEDQQKEIAEYLDKKHTATWFAKQPEAASGEAITAELIYYWMSSFRIDWEAQYWNLDRLLTLVKVFSVKQDNKPRKQSSRDRHSEIMRLNAQRRAELGSNG